MSSGPGGCSLGRLPPPPPVPEGAVLARAPGYADANATALVVPVPMKARRPGIGEAGHDVNLCVNHFRARLAKRDDVYQYNVSIEPEVTNKQTCREVMMKLRETFGVAECGGKHGAYDGEKSLFTSGSLSFTSKEFPVFLDDRKGPSFRPGDLGGRHRDSSSTHSPLTGRPDDKGAIKRRRTAAKGRDFTVRIEFAAKIQMEAIDEMLRGGAMGRGGVEQEKRALDALRVLDIVLRESASRRNYLLARDNFFHPSLGQIGNLGEGVEAWRGYHSSVRPTGLGLTLNLDITMTTVLKPILVEEFLKEKFNIEDLNRMQARDWAKSKSILKNIRVDTVHMAVARSHKIAGFSDRPIRELTFTKKVKDGYGNVRNEEISVQSYYLDVYSYTFKYPRLPALDVGNKKKSTFLPLEFCKIVAGQRYTKSLSSRQRMAQISACKQGPEDRRRTCENAINVSKYGSDKLVAEFGLTFENRLASIQGRILPPPQLEFGDGKTELPRDGRWNFNYKKLKKGVIIGPWAVAVFDPRCNDGEYIGNQLRVSCMRRGMGMPRPLQVVKEPHDALRYSPEQRVERMFCTLKERCSQEPEFILAILPDKDSPIYVPLKKLCETEIGIISQCMVRPRQINDQFLGNLALKINLKFGGFNSPLRPQMITCLGRGSTIIFGMDVSHGSPGDVNVPSIAALVATKNWPDVFHYTTQVRTQPAKMEMIQGLHEPNKGGMVIACLKAFYDTCHGDISMRKPSQIIVYRDGISESQFAECLENEFTAFKRACRDLEEDYNPGITFIVAQKRHNTRFFPQVGDNRDRLKNGNVLPGTVVDSGVCHPHSYDFFLVSQAGLIGTSRPTYYHVLVNENKLGPDDIQTLTNNLCYTFGRCTTAISMAAPAAYAHIVAARYRKLIDTWGEGSETSSLRSSRDGRLAAPRPVPALPALKVLKNREHSMFFC